DDTSPQEREAAVDGILETVGLVPQRARRIRELSGGQARRASLANEVLSGPGLVFLDEVTSGLDEQTDAEMMQLFRRMADSGKTIVCVTHSLTNVMATCDLIAVVAPGGTLAFFGSPAEACGYFGVDRLGEIYGRLSERSATDWKSAYRLSEYHQ